MTLSGQVFNAYRGFGKSMHAQMALNPREEKLLFYVVLASLLGFVSQVPSILTEVATTTNTEMTITNQIGTKFATSMFFGPLMYYGLAALAHVIAKMFGGKGSFTDARLAFFWSLLVFSPMLLLLAALRVVFPVPEVTIIGLIVASGLFVYCFGTCLSIAEKFPTPYLTIASIIGIVGVLFAFARVLLAS